jgi:hypothetical protein
MKRFGKIQLLLVVAITIVATLCSQRAMAQHTLTLTGGTGASYARFYPTEQTKWMWGCENFGVSWRYYSEKPRFVGAVGVDLEYKQRGYFMGWTYTSLWTPDENGEMTEKRTYKFYNRKINTLMLPLVWQPHFYFAKNRVRVFVEAALVLSYNISSTYSYENDERPGGKYEMKIPRDNPFGYGLAGGAGFALLFGQVEVGFKARYDFGYSDILKNRNKYYSNSTDGYENPFYYTPLRSPIDNLSFSLTVGWRFNKRGFNEWFVVRPKKEKALKTFNFSEQTGANRGSQSSSQRR